MSNENNNVHSISPNPNAPAVGGNGGGGGNDLRERVARIEGQLESILPHLATKADIESIRTEIKDSTNTQLKWFISTILGIATVVFVIARYFT